MSAAEPTFCRGDRVRVEEQGIRAWAGTVLSVKVSKISGVWVEIARDNDLTYSIPAPYVTLEPETAVTA